MTAVIVVGVAALGGYLWLKSRGSTSSTGTSSASSTSPSSGTNDVTTTYGLGPNWVLTAVKDLHSAPKHKPTVKKDKKPGGERIRLGGAA